MSPRNSKKKKSKIGLWVICLIIALLVITVVLYMTGFFKQAGTSENNTSGYDTENDSSAAKNTEEKETMDPVEADSLEAGDVYIPLGSNINVIGIGSYLGDYVEDGSDELVDGVMMITVENQGEQNIQLVDITINDTYHFELTTLLPGQKMLVLEKDKLTYGSSLTVTSVELSNIAIFQEAPSLQEDKLSFTTSDNKIVVANISDETTPAGKIFYKNHLEDGTLLGGITYCGSIPALEPGEEVTLNSAHYTVDVSEISFVTFGE